MTPEPAVLHGKMASAAAGVRITVRTVGCSLAATVLAMSLFVLLGWAIGSVALTSILPDLVSMKVNTALCLGLLAVACLLRASVPRGVTLGLVGLVSVVAVLSIVQYLAGVSFGIDELFVRDPDRSVAPGRMSGTTALCLLLLSAALAVPTRTVLAQGAAITAQALGFIGMLGYLYGVGDLYQVGPFETMALHTSVAIVLLGASVQVRVPRGMLIWVFSGDDAGALLLRRVLPVLVVGIPLIGLVRLVGQKAGAYNDSFGVAIMVSSAVLVLTAAMLVAGRRAQRLDARRRQSVEDLAELNRNLERRVIEGAAELERQNTQLALRNDRDRIARDLHDRVIQRLFASGLQLAALERAVARGGTPQDEVETMTGRIEDVIGELNGVAAELRASIFSLTVMARSGDAVGAAEAAVEHFGRSLAFDPEVEIDPRLDDLPAEMIDQVVAVLREGVANVARHAHATWARVEATVDDGLLRIVIDDDGLGMPDQPTRSSGVVNLGERAGNLGGAVRWEARSPRGTRLTWEVPVPPTPPVRPAPERPPLSVPDAPVVRPA